MSSYYLVEHWAGKTNDGPTSKRTYEVVLEKDIWNYIDKAHKEQKRIVIWRLADCIIDWT